VGILLRQDDVGERAADVHADEELSVSQSPVPLSIVDIPAAREGSPAARAQPSGPIPATQIRDARSTHSALDSLGPFGRAMQLGRA
jgi:hypothetical protein